MTKYSSELKIDIVSKYLKNEYSLGGLAKEYGIGLSVINSWVDLAKAQGLSALK
ncbi:MAG: transposase, partial [Lactobacillus sp.]|nr:transposase [Lactobacillus sp.]